MQDADVIVVGAGAAGLYAARLVEDAGLSAQVLEARTRVGGRLSGEEIDGVTREYGGQWIAPYQTAVLSLIEELGLELFSRHRAGRDVFLSAGQRTVHAPHEWPISDEADAAFTDALETIARVSRELDPEAVWTHPQAEALDSSSFEDWLEGNVANLEARALLRLMVADAYVTKPATMFSTLFCAHLFASGTGQVEDLLDPDLVLDRRVRGGLHRLPERLAEELATPVRLGVRVLGIAHAEDHVTVTTDDGTFSARSVIVAIPPNLWSNLSITPALPEAFQVLAGTAAQGMVFKAQAVYDRPFWREAGLSGTGYGPGEFVHEIYDNSPEDGSRGVLVGFIAGDNARRAAALSQEQRAQAAIASFAAYFGEQALEHQGYFDHDWTADALTGGAYVASFPPGTITDAKRRFHETPGPIAFAASDIAGLGFGHVEGALRSGAQAAQTTLERLRASGRA